jgi:hypothetical protein
MIGRLTTSPEKPVTTRTSVTTIRSSYCSPWPFCRRSTTARKDWIRPLMSSAPEQWSLLRPRRNGWARTGAAGAPPLRPGHGNVAMAGAGALPLHWWEEEEEQVQSMCMTCGSRSQVRWLFLKATTTQPNGLPNKATFLEVTAHSCFSKSHSSTKHTLMMYFLRFKLQFVWLFYLKFDH